MKELIRENKVTIIFIIVVILIIAGLAFGEYGKEAKAERLEKEVEQAKIEEMEKAVAKYKSVEENENYPVATITMEDGSKMVFELYPNKAPTTVENFIYLANSGFYDGLTFHRTVPDFVIQGGSKDASITGTSEYKIKGEFAANGFTANDIKHEIGTLSMARAQDYDTAGTQFFVVTGADNSFLDGSYAAFGKLIEGLDVMQQIANVEVITRDQTSMDADKPVNPPVMKEVRVDTKGVEYAEPEKIQ